jgi:hypothetical protein
LPIRVLDATGGFCTTIGASFYLKGRRLLHA